MIAAPLIGVVFATAQGETALSGAAGASVMSLGRQAGLLLGECEGSLACATCHVVVDPAWSERLPAATEDEESMLDTVFGLRPTSRLSCQIRLVPALDGIRMTIP